MDSNLTAASQQRSTLRRGVRSGAFKTFRVISGSSQCTFMSPFSIKRSYVISQRPLYQRKKKPTMLLRNLKYNFCAKHKQHMLEAKRNYLPPVVPVLVLLISPSKIVG